jgi:hypothetical protein
MAQRFYRSPQSQTYAGDLSSFNAETPQADTPSPYTPAPAPSGGNQGGWGLPQGGGGGYTGGSAAAGGFVKPQQSQVMPAKDLSNIQNDWAAFRGGLGNVSDQQYRTNLPQYVDQFNQQYGYNAHATGRPGDYDTMDIGNGQIVDTQSASGQAIWNPEYGGGFSDPSQQQYGNYLNQFLGQLGGQSAKYQDPNWQARLDQANQATDRLIAYLQQRATQLQGPAYTGAEQEILRTQALDPIERDRQAQNQRVMQNLSARGLDPNSGIAQALMNDTNNVYNQQRASAQNELAYKQINEQRSRQQEAQQLLGLIPQAQRAGAQGDLGFLQQLDYAANAPYQTGMGAANALYQMPRTAMSDALTALGAGGSNPNDIFNMAMQMYGAQNQQQAQTLPWYEQMGALLPYLTGAHS